MRQKRIKCMTQLPNLIYNEINVEHTFRCYILSANVEIILK